MITAYLAVHHRRGSAQPRHTVRVTVIPLFFLRYSPVLGHNVHHTQGEIGSCSDEGTPGPIPNPVVKFVSADGTWGVSLRESRSPPILALFFFPVCPLRYCPYCTLIAAPCIV